MVFSSDLFDTLVFRACKEPYEIFSQMQQLYSLTDFTRHRIQCERDSLHDTYQQLSKIYHWNKEEESDYKQKELDLEWHNLYPISSRIQQLPPDSLIISDTYLDQSFLERLVQRYNIPHQRLYASPNGKYNGWIWDQIRRDGIHIDHHMGDNRHSDVDSASSHGISASLVTDSSFNDKEASSPRPLALLQRFIRLQLAEQSPFFQMIYHEQIYINIPFLLSFSHSIHEYATKHSINTILFSMRDTFYLHNIFQQLYPRYRSRLLLCSRRVYMDPSLYYCDYFQNLLDPNGKSLIVDIHGTGRSLTEFLSKHFPDSPISILYFFTSSPVRYSNLHAIRHNFSNDTFEVLNYISCGTLRSFDSSGGVFDDLEYPPYVSKTIERPIQLCLLYLAQFHPTIVVDPSDLHLHYTNSVYNSIHQIRHSSNPHKNFIDNFHHLFKNPILPPMHVYILHQKDKTVRHVNMQKLLKELHLDHRTTWVEPVPISRIYDKNIFFDNVSTSSISRTQLSHLLTYLSILHHHDSRYPCLILEDDLSPLYPLDVCRMIMESFHNHMAINNRHLCIDLFYWEFCYAKCYGLDEIYNSLHNIPFYCTAAIYYPPERTQVVLKEMLNHISLTRRLYATDEILYQIVQRKQLRAFCHFALFEQDVQRFGSFIEGSSTFQRRPCSDHYTNRFQSLIYPIHNGNDSAPSYIMMVLLILLVAITVICLTIIMWKRVYSG